MTTTTLAPVINLFTRAPITHTGPVGRIVPPTIAWWTCPHWCQPDLCDGGDNYDFARGLMPSPRSHRGVIYTEQIPDLDGEATVRIELIALESPTGFTDGVHIKVDTDDVITGDLDALARIADAIQAAIHHARQELPATSPRSLPYAGGGRASNPLEAS